MATAQLADVVTDLHGDLARKWRAHGDRIEEAWRSFGPGLRAKAFKAGLAEGSVLRHSQDTSLGNVYKFLPEFNLRDVTAPGDFLLDMLKHRATTSLEEQYLGGFNNRPGDYDHIMEMMRTRNLRHINEFRDCWTFFTDGDKYGRSVKILKEKAQTLAVFEPAIRARLCVPQSVGELVLQRQQFLLQSLNIICEDILDIGSTTRSQKALPKKPVHAAAAALSNLSIGRSSDQVPEVDIPHLVNSAHEQKTSLLDVLNLMCTEPVFLAHQVNLWFFSRPELVPDEKGRVLPVHTDRYISGAVLDSMHNVVKANAIWEYMTRLMELLRCTTEKKRQSLILQEISNLGQFEYLRTQALLRRQVSTVGSGSKYFKRNSNTYDNGNARVILKAKPEAFTQNPQLHYLLRLCQPETTAQKAVEWIKELDRFHNAHPGAIEGLADSQVDALADLVIIVSFMESLSGTISMPVVGRKKTKLFAGKWETLETEVNEAKLRLDLRAFAAPIDHLLEPGMAEAALKALDDFIVKETGTKLGFIYQDLVDECIGQLHAELESEVERQRKASADQQNKATEYVPFPPEVSKEPAMRIQERREKEKTRPTHISAYETTPFTQSSAATDTETCQPPEQFKVKQSTFDVFSAIFPSDEQSGGIHWADFEAAMCDLGFAIVPKYGSVYTFYPPENSSNKRSLTIHRPHKSRIEGYRLFFYRLRLQRVFGWSADCFEPLA